MPALDIELLAIAALAAIAVGCLFYVFVYPLLTGSAKTEKRVEALSQSGHQRRAADRMAELTASRKKSVAESLKELEESENAKRRLSLADRIAQAGLTLEPRTFMLLSAGLGLGGAVFVFAAAEQPLVALMVALILGLGLPNWLLSSLRKRRMARFLNEFPNAIDIIVRGIKSGLPLGDCLRIIAAEAREPLRSEFRYIVESQSLGLSVGDACARLFKRMPLQEANFFVIVIQIQQKAGGNLSEALSGLSRVLRDRKKMKAKVAAMSMEAKASAVIIGSLPFIMAVMVQIVSPGFIDPLFKKQTGHIILMGAGFWMLCGIVTMKSMINFDI
jgi:tight adherence protein B